MMFSDDKFLSGSAKLSDLLTQMNEKGEFPYSVLTDHAGFPVASASGPGMDTDLQAAVAALMQKIADQAQKVDIGEVDEISIYDRDRRRLVCRSFQAGTQNLILAVMVDEGRSYRRITNSAIAAIRRAWKV